MIEVLDSENWRLMAATVWSILAMTRADQLARHASRDLTVEDV